MSSVSQLDTPATGRPPHIDEQEWALRVELASAYRVFDHLGWTMVIYIGGLEKAPIYGDQAPASGQADADWCVAANVAPHEEVSGQQETSLVACGELDQMNLSVIRLIRSLGWTCPEAARRALRAQDRVSPERVTVLRCCDFL